MLFPLRQWLEKTHPRHAQRPAHDGREYERRRPAGTGHHRYAVRLRRDNPKHL